MIPNQDCAAVCGLFCGTCPSYIQQQCGGCLSENCSCDCFNGFKDCAKEHNAQRCYQCGEFPCEKLKRFSSQHIVNGICHHKDVLEDLNKMQEKGVCQWVAEQTQSHTCKNCGQLIAWFEKQCNCKK